MHWVSASHAFEAEIRLYDNLFTKEVPDADPDFKENINPNSLEILTGAKLEPGLRNATPGDHYQFLRQGYFNVDTVDSKSGAPIFNRTVGLRDTWAKIEKK